MSTTVRKQAPRLAQPASRYWRGKAPKGVADIGSESEEDVGEQGQEGEDEDVPFGGLENNEEEEEADDEDEVGEGNGHLIKRPARALGKMNIALKDVDIRDGKVIVAGREESGRTAMEENESEYEEDEEDQASPVALGEEEESSEEESESEDEPSAPAFRPVFIPKRGRITVLEREKETQDSEEFLEKKKVEEEERKKQSHDMVAESIRRELLEKEKEKETPDVDDTDGLDPETEFEAWRLRELNRIKQDKEEQTRREQEREEIERRRALPEEQRLKEDMEHAKKTREKPKGQQKFLQKYWHKGAFHQDDEVLKKHDYTEATESTVDVSLLPKVMQVRDFGKRSRTKYTHLLDQDTTAGNGGFGGSVPPNKHGATPGGPSSGCFVCGGPHLKKDCPQNTEHLKSGANMANEHGATRSWGRDRDGERDRQSWKERKQEPDRPREREGDYADRYANRRPDSYDHNRDKYSSRRHDRDHRERHSRRSPSYSRASSRSPRYDDRRRRHSKERSLEDHHRGKRVRTS